MSKEKDMLREAVKALYKSGASIEDIRTCFTESLNEVMKTYKTQNTIAQSIIEYIDLVYPDMTKEYNRDNIKQFAANMLEVVDKDIAELRELRDGGYEKVDYFEINGCRGTGTLPITDMDDETLRKFLQDL